MIRIFTSVTQKTGELGEKAAVQYLLKEGYSIIDQNVSNKYGEIDIIAKKQRVYYFFEVKTGKHGSSIAPAENLSPSKIRKLLVSVQHYCLIKDIADYRVQGIVVLYKPDTTYTVEVLELF